LMSHECGTSNHCQSAQTASSDFLGENDTYFQTIIGKFDYKYMHSFVS
jgi:hypothetical protein